MAGRRKSGSTPAKGDATPPESSPSAASSETARPNAEAPAGAATEDTKAKVAAALQNTSDVMDDDSERALVLENPEIETDIDAPRDPSDDKTATDSPSPLDDSPSDGTTKKPAETASREPTPRASSASARAPEHRSSPLPLVLAGVVTAALGFAAGSAGLVRGSGEETAALRTEMATQAERVEALSGQVVALGDRVEGLPPAPDLGGLTADVTAAMAATTASNARIDEVAASLAALETRLTDLEKRPISEGVSQAAIDAYERELRALQDSVAAQRAEIEQMSTEAAAAEANAARMASEAMARAALSRVMAALDSGTPFTAPLSEVEASVEAPVPEALSAASAEGIPSMDALRDSFVPAAREALAAARDANVDEGEGTKRLFSFFQKQFGVRSVTPREGDDPDAILSRAEAALHDNRLTDALAELDNLPPAAVEAMAAWRKDADARQAALAAARDLSQQINNE